MASLLPLEGVKGANIKLAKQEMYRNIWGIEPNTGENGYIENRFIPVGFSSQESLYGDANPLELKLKEFIRGDVMKYTGYTFTEYMELIPAHQEVIIKTCLEHKKENDSRKQIAYKDLERTFSDLK